MDNQIKKSKTIYIKINDRYIDDYNDRYEIVYNHHH